jgi:hypothetical protein
MRFSCTALLFLLIPLSSMIAQQTATITSPNGGERYSPGDTVAITWTGGPSTGSLRLQFSTDGGERWTYIADDARNGVYRWVVPNMPSSRCLVRALDVRPDSTLVEIATDRDLHSVNFSDDNTKVAIGLFPGGATVYDAGSGAILLRVPVVPGAPMGYRPYAAFSPDGEILAVTEQQLARLHDIRTGDSVGSFDGATGPFVFSPDGRRFLSGYRCGYGGQCRAAVYDVETRRLTHLLDGMYGEVISVGFSRDGRLAIVGNSNQNVRVWDIERDTMIRNYTHPLGSASAVALDHNTTRAVAGSASRTGNPGVGGLRTWDMASGDPLGLVSSGGGALAVQYRSDGGRILSVDDSRVRIYSALSLTKERSLPDEQRSVAAIAGAFSRDGRHAAIGWHTGGMQIWTLEREIGGDTSDATFTIDQPDVVVADVDLDSMVAPAARFSNRRLLRISNRSRVDIRLLNLSLAGTDSLDFRFLPLRPMPFKLAAGKYEDVEITFRPSAFGRREARFTVITDTDTLDALLHGVGVLKPIQGTLSEIRFPVVFEGETYDTVVAIVRNADTVAWDIDVALRDGPDTSQFAIIAGGGDQRVLPGDSLRVQVRSTPTMPNLRSQSIHVTYNGFDSVVVIKLFGGYPPWSHVRTMPVPNGYDLGQSIPNPARERVTIPYAIARAGHVRLGLRSIVGGDLVSLVDGKQSAGEHRVDTDISALPSGLYLYTLEVDGITISRQMLVVR